MGTVAWVVLIEAERAATETPVEAWRLRRVLENMPGGDPVGLHSGDRIAVQVHVDAGDELAALGVARAGLRAALPGAGLSGLRVIRAEVMTAQEFGRDCRPTAEEAVPEGGYDYDATLAALSLMIRQLA